MNARTGRRSYSPELGRWINRDPIEEKGGVGLYSFVGNAALKRSDVLGQFWWESEEEHNAYAELALAEISRREREHALLLTYDLRAICPKRCYYSALGNPISPEECNKQAPGLAKLVASAIAETAKEELVRSGGLPKTDDGFWAKWSRNVEDQLGDDLPWDEEYVGIQCSEWADSLERRIGPSVEFSGFNAFGLRRVENAKMRKWVVLKPKHNWVELFTPQGAVAVDPWATSGFTYRSDVSGWAINSVYFWQEPRWTRDLVYPVGSRTRIDSVHDYYRVPVLR